VIDILYDPPNRPPRKPFKWIVIDSLIVAAFMFIATLPYDRPPTLSELYISIRAFLYFFLFELMFEMGIKPYIYKRRSNGNRHS